MENDKKRAGGRKVANGKWIAASRETFAVRIANHASFRGLEILRKTFQTLHVFHSREVELVPPLKEESRSRERWSSW